MLQKRKEPKGKSIALTLMRDLQGSAAQKLAMFEKVRAAGGFAKEHPADLAEAEKSVATRSSRRNLMMRRPSSLARATRICR